MRNLQASSSVLGTMNDLSSKQAGRLGTKLSTGWGFLGGQTIVIRPNHRINLLQRKSSRVFAASWLTSPQIASSAFPLATVVVLPFYIFMVVAPKSEITKKLMESSIPYIVLGLLYAYLVYLSWTPDTMQLLFPKFPELSGIANLFSRAMTLASGWIHLLAVDLFAARQVYRDGLQNDIVTRHSVLLCLLSCPTGLITHFITKAIYSVVQKRWDR